MENPFQCSQNVPSSLCHPSSSSSEPLGCADAERALLDPRSALAVAAGVTQSQARSRDHSSSWRDHLSQAVSPGHPEPKARGGCPPQTTNSPRFVLGQAGNSSFSRCLISNGKHPQKIINGHHPVSLRLCDPSVASLATSSPQQQVLVAPGLSPGQAGMSPQRLG